MEDWLTTSQYKSGVFTVFRNCTKSTGFWISSGKIVLAAKLQAGGRPTMT
jgi:hypothetical protein